MQSLFQKQQAEMLYLNEQKKREEVERKQLLLSLKYSNNRENLSPPCNADESIWSNAVIGC